MFSNYFAAGLVYVGKGLTKTGLSDFLRKRTYEKFYTVWTVFQLYYYNEYYLESVSDTN